MFAMDSTLETTDAKFEIPAGVFAETVTSCSIILTVCSNLHHKIGQFSIQIG